MVSEIFARFTKADGSRIEIEPGEYAITIVSVEIADDAKTLAVVPFTVEADPAQPEPEPEPEPDVDPPPVVEPDPAVEPDPVDPDPEPQPDPASPQPQPDQGEVWFNISTTNIPRSAVGTTVATFDGQARPDASRWSPHLERGENSGGNALFTISGKNLVLSKPIPAKDKTLSIRVEFRQYDKDGRRISNTDPTGDVDESFTLNVIG